MQPTLCRWLLTSWLLYPGFVVATFPELQPQSRLWAVPWIGLVPSFIQQAGSTPTAMPQQRAYLVSDGRVSSRYRPSLCPTPYRGAWSSPGLLESGCQGGVIRDLRCVSPGTWEYLKQAECRQHPCPKADPLGTDNPASPDPWQSCPC